MDLPAKILYLARTYLQKF